MSLSTTYCEYFVVVVSVKSNQITIRPRNVASAVIFISSVLLFYFDPLLLKEDAIFIT